MSATSQIVGEERSPSRRFAAVATLALMTLLALPRPGRSAELDVTTLCDRLHDTPAIGIVTKLTLKRDIEHLIDQLADYHAGRATTTLDAIHTDFDMLVTRTVALLENGETDLAEALADSSERIWTELIDPLRFAAL